MKRGFILARIDIKDIDDDTITAIDNQCKKYGISHRTDYIKLLIKLDILTNIVERIKKEDNNGGEKNE